MAGEGGVKGKRGPRDLLKKTVAQLKRVLWDVTSEFVRRRDTDSHTGWGNCISCGKPVLFGTKDCQAGHYHAKGNSGSHHLALPRFPGDELVERNINVQCSGCNMMEGGNFVNQEKGLREKYGDEAVDELKEEGAKNEIIDRNRPDLIETIEHYKQELKELEAA